MEADRKELQQIAQRCSAVQAQLDSKRKSLEEALQRLLPKSCLDPDDGEMALLSMHQDICLQLVSATEEIEIHRSNAKRSQELASMLLEISSHTTDLDERLKDVNSKMDAYKLEKSRLMGEHSALAASLPFGSHQEASESLEAMQSRLELLKRRWDAAKTALDQASSQVQKSDTALAEKRAGLEKLLASLSEQQEALQAAIAAQGFTSLKDYHSRLLTEAQIQSIKGDVDQHHSQKGLLEHDVIRLEKAAVGKERVDLDSLIRTQEALALQETELSEDISRRQSRWDTNIRVLQSLEKTRSHIEKTEADYLSCKTLSDTANGEISGQARITFETYIQMSYFNQILRAANRRFAVMSNQRYELRPRETAANLRSQTGLDLDVLDHYTGKVRDVRSLSGGESFNASLSLALGLSDVVQQNAGGIQLEAMFIDEGFGALDPEALDAAVSMLQNMTGDRCIVGIISHVGELASRIEKQLIIKKGHNGSSVRINV